MLNRYRKMAVALLSTILIATGTTAYAYPVLNGSDAKISMAQAISIAEKRVNGRAVDADFDHSRWGWVYEIEVFNNNGKEFDIKVDPVKGTVLSVVEDWD